MESIIIFAIIAIASSVIQSAAQKNKQQQAKGANTQAAQPNMQPAPKGTVKPSVKGQYTTPKRTAAPIQTPKMQEARLGVERDIPMEGVLTEALDNVIIPEQRQETVSTDSSMLLQDISFDELRRSIIMAEVLGKPKALRK